VDERKRGSDLLWQIFYVYLRDKLRLEFGLFNSVPHFDFFFRFGFNYLPSL
jgi:hypothetical protein